MNAGTGNARARVASGRLLWLLLAAGCQMAGVAPTSPGDVRPPDPSLIPGTVSPAQAAEAQALLDSARASFDAARYLESLRIAGEVMDRYRSAPASGGALLLSARAEAASGSPERADAAAERYAALLPPDDPRVAEVRLLQHDFLVGQPIIQLDRLLRIGSQAQPQDAARALTLSRSLVDSLSVDELELVAGGATVGGIAAAPVLARLSAELLARGEDARAQQVARDAIASGASGADQIVAEGVLRGELPDGLRAERVFSIATVLPAGGPPALADYSALIAEGVEVAVATVLGDAYTVTVVERDDEGDPVRAGEIVAELEAEGVAGAVGFLLDDALVEAGAARLEGLPLVSPTARTAGSPGDGIFSLQGADPRSAELGAVYAATRGLQRVAMLYPDTPEAAAEADAFEVAAASFGVPVVGRFPYPEGVTDLEDELRSVQRVLRAAEIAALGLTEDDTLHVELLDPVGVFMPIPPEDVELVGSQFAHNGLDTLAIEIVGTSGWTDPSALEDIDRRLLEGVVATAPVAAGPGSPGYAAFREAYESHFRRTLVSNAPAAGYDAALLLLEALRPGRLRPGDVRRSFDELTEVEGANGVYSIVEGRVVRRTELVRFEGDRLVPVPIG